jgi:glutathione S-transferase
MSKFKLSYFDFPGGRGEECRLALHVAGVEFDDDRIPGAAWADKKAATPFGAMPVLEVEGQGSLAQSNVILRYVGHAHGLHPSDPWKAAQHESIMGAAEDLRAQLTPVLRIKGDEREAARKEFADGPLAAWISNVDKLVEGPFVGGKAIGVADLKLYIVMKWFISGGVDHISGDVFAKSPKLSALYEAVDSHPKVRDWYAD